MNGNGYTPRPLEEAAARLQETLGMALVIADEAARSDIESLGQPDRAAGERGWYYIDPHEYGRDSYDAMTLIRAAKYLTLRDRLETDPTDPQRVRVKT